MGSKLMDSKRGTLTPTRYGGGNQQSRGSAWCDFTWDAHSTHATHIVFVHQKRVPVHLPKGLIPTISFPYPT